MNFLLFSQQIQDDRHLEGCVLFRVSKFLFRRDKLFHCTWTIIPIFQIINILRTIIRLYNTPELYVLWRTICVNKTLRIFPQYFTFRLENASHEASRFEIRKSILRKLILIRVVSILNL